MGMTGSRLTEDEFTEKSEEFLTAIIDAKDDYDAVRQLIASYKLGLTNEHLGDLLAAAIAADVDAKLLCYCITDLHDDDIYEKMIDYSQGAILAAIPLSDRNYALCELAVFYNALMLKYVPEQLRDENLCRIAIQGNSQSLEFVPPLLQTEQMQIKCVTANHKNMEFVPQQQRSFRLYSIAIAKDANMLAVVPEDEHYFQYCVVATQIPAAIQHAKRKQKICKRINQKRI